MTSSIASKGIPAGILPSTGILVTSSSKLTKEVLYLDFKSSKTILSLTF